MTVVVIRYGHKDNKGKIIGDNDYFIEINRQKLKSHLAKLEIPYDPNVSIEDSFFPTVAKCAKLQDNDYEYVQIGMKKFDNSVIRMEVKKSGLDKMKDELSLFNIKLVVDADIKV